MGLIKHNGPDFAGTQQCYNIKRFGFIFFVNPVEMANFTVKVWDTRVNYLGICCDAGIFLTLLPVFNYLMGLSGAR